DLRRAGALEGDILGVDLGKIDMLHRGSPLRCVSLVVLGHGYLSETVGLFALQRDTGGLPCLQATAQLKRVLEAGFAQPPGYASGLQPGVAVRDDRTVLITVEFGDVLIVQSTAGEVDCPRQVLHPKFAIGTYIDEDGVLLDVKLGCLGRFDGSPTALQALDFDDHYRRQDREKGRDQKRMITRKLENLFHKLSTP